MKRIKLVNMIHEYVEWGDAIPNDRTILYYLIKLIQYIALSPIFIYCMPGILIWYVIFSVEHIQDGSRDFKYKDGTTEQNIYMCIILILLSTFFYCFIIVASDKLPWLFHERPEY